MAAIFEALKGVWGWKWQISLALVALLAWARGKEIEGLHGQLAADKAKLAQIAADGAAQAAQDVKINADEKARTNALQNQLDELLKDHAGTSAALADRVRAFAALRASCAGKVSPGSDPAGPIEGNSGSGPGAGSAQSVGDALATVTASCQTVIDEFRACSKWTQTVKCH
jgi:hypothetical protein